VGIVLTFNDKVATFAEGFKINLLAAQHSPSTMEPWETIIKDLAAHPSKVSTTSYLNPSVIAV
jgi:hypothetical protein